MNNYVLGRKGEEQASELFGKMGMEIVDRNFQYFSQGRGRKGEIDLIAYKSNLKILHFVEVKTRSNKQFGSALEQISGAKLRSLKSAIEYYCLKNPQFQDSFKQIDIVAIDGSSKSQVFFNVVSFDS